MVRRRQSEKVCALQFKDIRNSHNILCELTYCMAYFVYFRPIFHGGGKALPTKTTTTTRRRTRKADCRTYESFPATTSCPIAFAGEHSHEINGIGKSHIQKIRASRQAGRHADSLYKFNSLKSVFRSPLHMI